MEARRLEHNDRENLKQRERVSLQLLDLQEALLAGGLSEGQRVDLQRRIGKTERLRESILDMERTIATRRQTLLLATTAHATWAAALAALAALAFSLAQLLRPS